MIKKARSRKAIERQKLNKCENSKDYDYFTQKLKLHPKKTVDNLKLTAMSRSGSQNNIISEQISEISCENNFFGV
jgi:hypothetical protein